MLDAAFNPAAPAGITTARSARSGRSPRLRPRPRKRRHHAQHHHQAAVQDSKPPWKAGTQN